MELDKKALDRYLTTPPEDVPIILHKYKCERCETIFYLDYADRYNYCPNCSEMDCSAIGKQNFFEE